MKIIPSFLKLATLIILLPKPSFSQLKIVIDNGMVRIEDGSLFFMPGNYRTIADSLDEVLKSGRGDTTVLFECALIYDQSNNQLAKPVPGDKDAFEHLLKAGDLVEKAFELKMRALTLKILRAQIYRDLTYRFIDDQSWKFNSEEIQRRRALFNNYKTLANKYYSQLAQLDKNNAWDYQRLNVKTKYPIAD